MPLHEADDDRHPDATEWPNGLRQQRHRHWLQANLLTHRTNARNVGRMSPIALSATLRHHPVIAGRALACSGVMSHSATTITTGTGTTGYGWVSARE